MDASDSNHTDANFLFLSYVFLFDAIFSSSQIGSVINLFPVLPQHVPAAVPCTLTRCVFLPPPFSFCFLTSLQLGTVMKWPARSLLCR